METLYGLKRKTTNRWLKLLLLLFVAVGFGIPNLNAQTKAIKVADDRQLIDAMENHSIGTIELAPGYYAYLNTWADSGTKVVKRAIGNGDRDLGNCTYFIISRAFCFDNLTNGFAGGYADAGTSSVQCPGYPAYPPPLADCCPGENKGKWIMVDTPLGASYNFTSPIDQQAIFTFEVDMPGVYTLAYEWTPGPGVPEYAYVETEYYFYGPPVVTLSAPDVCYLDESSTTYVTFDITGDVPDPLTTVEWTLNGAAYAGPDAGPGFDLAVSYCGSWQLSVTVTPTKCPPVTKTIDINFSCDPVADAGPDMYLCNETCFVINGKTGLPSVPPTRRTDGWTINWSWTGPHDGGLTILPAHDSTVTVCRDLTKPCSFGEYEITMEVINGLCEDDTTITAIFYQQPIANAGKDSSFCNDFDFNLWAVPFAYCGDDENYWSSHYWTTVFPADCGQPDKGLNGVGGTGVVVFSDPTSATSAVTISGGNCPWGQYTFYWVEKNSKGLAFGGCCAYDDVVVTILEQPIADAGEDYWTCVDADNTPYTFRMTGSMEYCYSMQGLWAKSCGPGDVVFDNLYTPGAIVSFPEPGRYRLTWTVWNAECADTAEVLYDWLEQPTAIAEIAEDAAACDALCYSLADVGITKYVYTGTDQGECPNYWDMSHWFYVDGPCSDPAEVTFAPDNTKEDAVLCVEHYGGYTIGWVELNKPDDKDYYCSDTSIVFIEFYETPTPFAGDDSTICGNCYTLQGELYHYLGGCNQHLNDSFYWEFVSGPCVPQFDPFVLKPEVCIPDNYPECYGTYRFKLHEFNGECEGTDIVDITFNKIPDPIPLCYKNTTNCLPGMPYFNLNEPEFFILNCLQPNDTIQVCADDCTSFDVFCPNCGEGGFPWWNPAYFGWTFEWSVVAPAGTTVESVPGYYDFDANHWIFPTLDICWGECCDYARIYLTITTPECELTIVYYVYVTHKPCANIEGPDVSDVGTLTEYCNICPPEFDQSCLLYNWTAEHCGTIESGQGTECIEVLWTDYNVNGGWGEITLTVFDTCTGCCNYDEMLVKIWPEGTVGKDTLSGQVFYDNNGVAPDYDDIDIPLNGVHITLKNGTVAVFETESYVKFVEELDTTYTIPGYYEFPDVNGATTFDIEASYDAPWYGANATDALAVQLKVIGSLPIGFQFDNLVSEAMDVNNSNTISATDALWIKQRAIEMVRYFPAGDWVFDPDMSAAAEDGPYNFYTLNAGDANRSNFPASGKAAPAIDLLTDGTMNVVTGQEFELPIRIADASQFGAITLDLGYNSALIEVVDVILVDGMISNISNGNVSIAWSSVNPMILAENNVVVTLKAKAISPFTSAESLFSIGLNSEFADGAAKVIEPVTLKTFGVTTDPAATDYFLSANRPNPFSNSTFIEYTMPESGKVKLSVLDMLGQELAVLVDATQGAGSYTVEFSAVGLSTGVYIYKITVDGETRDFISTQRMVISH